MINKPHPSAEMIEICKKIGIYLQKTYGKDALDRSLKMAVDDFVLENNTLTIHTPRPGFWIGPKGKIITELEQVLGLKIGIIESKWCWHDFIRQGMKEEEEREWPSGHPEMK